MPLDTTDPYYRAEVIPGPIAAIGVALCARYHVGPDHFGVRGNVRHTSGYHRSRRWVLNSADSAHGSGDYSVTLAADKTGVADDCSAFDFTPATWGTADNRAKMRTLTQRLVAACQARDPRVWNVREVAGTLDGTTVVTWDCSRNAFKSPFDSSHLDHLHGSIYRSRTRADQSGIVSVMLGGTMAEWAQAQIDAVMWQLTGNPAGPLHARINQIQAQLAELTGRPVAPAVDVQALAAALAGPLADALPDNVDSAMVVAAFQDPTVLATLEEQTFKGSQRAERE